MLICRSICTLRLGKSPRNRDAADHDITNRSRVAFQGIPPLIVSSYSSVFRSQQQRRWFTSFPRNVCTLSRAPTAASRRMSPRVPVERHRLSCDGYRCAMRCALPPPPAILRPHAPCAAYSCCAQLMPAHVSFRPRTAASIIITRIIVWVTPTLSPRVCCASHARLFRYLAACGRCQAQNLPYALLTQSDYPRLHSARRTSA